MSLMSLTAVELGRKIKEKEVTVEEAVTAALDAIEKREAQVHSFVTVDREGALKRAKEVQAKIDAGELTACGCAGSDQGQHVHEGAAYDLFFQNFIQFRPDLHSGGGP